MADKPGKNVTEVVEEPTDIERYINRQATGIGPSFVPETWDDMEAWASEHGGLIEFEGSPWWLLKDKSKLIDVPFIICDVRHYQGNFGDTVAVMLMTKDNLPEYETNRYVINDGSTGLYQQVVGMVERSGRKAGISCPRGLRKSEYQYQPVDIEGAPMGPPIPAVTYYVA